MNEPSIEESANSGPVPQLGMMLRALWEAPVRNTLLVLSGAWNQPFYDALSRRDFAQFLVQLGV